MITRFSNRNSTRIFDDRRAHEKHRRKISDNRPNFRLLSPTLYPGLPESRILQIESQSVSLKEVNRFGHIRESFCEMIPILYGKLTHPQKQSNSRNDDRRYRMFAEINALSRPSQTLYKLTNVGAPTIIYGCPLVYAHCFLL